MSTVHQFHDVLKFGFSEKATKFEKIFVVLLTRASCSVHATAYLSNSRRRFFKTNVVTSGIIQTLQIYLIFGGFLTFGPTVCRASLAGCDIGV